MSTKKKLLILLGAGSSLHQQTMSGDKIPSVAKLNGLMQTWSLEFHKKHGQILIGMLQQNLEKIGSYPNVYDELWKRLEDYLGKDKSNFEIALSEMITLSHWLKPAPYGSPIEPSVSIPLLQNCPDLSFQYISAQSITLFNRLASHMRSLSKSLDVCSDAFKSYKNTIHSLQENFDIGVYNLNYDNVALRALPDAYFGFKDNGDFEPARIYKKRDWGFIYHLHGSVHHNPKGDFSDYICWQHDLSKPFNDPHVGQSANVVSGGKSLPKTALIAGGHKLDQLLVEPFQTLYSSLVRHAYEADAFLVGGYGFADTHVNRTLRNRFLHGSRAPVVILDFAKHDELPLNVRSDAWSFNIKQALRVEEAFANPGKQSIVSNLENLKKENRFEVARQSRVAVWYNGFVEAECRIGDICGLLKGASRDWKRATAT